MYGEGWKDRILCMGEGWKDRRLGMGDGWKDRRLSRERDGRIGY